MTYSDYDLGYLPGGKVVEIRLTRPATVRLLDRDAFGDYRAGRPCASAGVVAGPGTCHLAVPRPGRWHLVIE